MLQRVPMTRRWMLGLCAATMGSAAAGCARAPVSETQSGPAMTSAGASPDASSAAPPSTPAPTPSGPAVERANGPRTRQEVALTFHGGGDPAIARELLAIFADQQSKVTVLAVGTWLAANPQLTHEVLDAGHELGNHTYSHLDIDSLSADAAQAEIIGCRDLLVSLAGSGGSLFRQSQAQTSTPLVLQLAGAAGYPVCLSYDIDSLDYTDPGPTAIRSNLATALPGSIVSLHFGHADTVTAMPLILADLAARGLQPVTATTLLR